MPAGNSPVVASSPIRRTAPFTLRPAPPVSEGDPVRRASRAEYPASTDVAQPAASRPRGIAPRRRRVAEVGGDAGCFVERRFGHPNRQAASWVRAEGQQPPSTSRRVPAESFRRPTPFAGNPRRALGCPAGLAGSRSGGSSATPAGKAFFARMTGPRMPSPTWEVINGAVRPGEADRADGPARTPAESAVSPADSPRRRRRPRAVEELVRRTGAFPHARRGACAAPRGARRRQTH